MDTREEQRAFFDSQSDALLAAADDGGGAAVQRFIEGFDDDAQRRVLYQFARMVLLHSEWPGRNCDDMIVVSLAGVEEHLRQADGAGNDELRTQRLNGANVLAYNLAADLADCWDDGIARETRHFEAGLAAACRCIGWREELDRPPWSHSMAWWARGMHELSLRQLDDSHSSFQKALEFARAAAEADGEPTEVSPRGTFGVILGHGYLAMVDALRGDRSGPERYLQSVVAFGEQLDNDQKADAARLGIDQLETARSRYIGDDAE